MNPSHAGRPLADETVRLVMEYGAGDLYELRPRTCLWSMDYK